MTKPANSITTYLPPIHRRIVKAMANYTGQSESSIVSDAVKEKIDKMTVDDKERILKLGEQR